VHQLERPVVGHAGVIGSAEPPQQLAPRRVQVVVAIEVEVVDEGQRELDLSGLGKRVSPV
jgi:hypothetical protein